MSIPARCNKRSCQARRNLSKHPEQYVRWPKCHMGGCDGLMYVDKYRLNKGSKDRAPKCTDVHCNYQRATNNKNPYHRIDNVGCDHYGDYVTKRNISPRSKHSPIAAADWIPF